MSDINEYECRRSRERYSRKWVIEDAESIVLIMGLEYIRTVPGVELTRIALKAAQGPPLTDELMSFQNADLVVEASDGETSQYVAVEISYKAHSSDTCRAWRNARLLTEFTGRPARAAIASVKNDDSVNRQITAGDIYWHKI